MTAALALRPTGTGFLDFAPESYEVIARGGPRSGQTPRISVVVATYNRAAMVKDAVNAIFAQDLPHEFEVIVVDDASQDSTTEVLASLAVLAPRPFLAIRLKRNVVALARNAGILHACGEFIAFTDDDCLPSPSWLSGLWPALTAGLDAVQGRTEAPPWQPQPLFSHFINTTRADGSFSTSNVAYRREAVIDAGGFDPGCDYWEDVDLGWRVVRGGAAYTFSSDALVYHRVIPQSPLRWLKHARNYENWPVKAARYPEFRRHLFLGLWVDWFHACMTLFAAGAVLAPYRRRFAALALPYLLTFPFRHGLKGRWPLLKAVAHFSHDCIALASLVRGSIRARTPVL